MVRPLTSHVFPTIFQLMPTKSSKSLDPHFDHNFSQLELRGFMLRSSFLAQIPAVLGLPIRNPLLLSFSDFGQKHDALTAVKQLTHAFFQWFAGAEIGIWLILALSGS